MRNLVAALALSVAAFALLPSGTAFACSTDLVRQDGRYNSADVDVEGCGYSSVDQRGVRNRAELHREGRRNGQIVGQYADGTRVRSEVRGRHNESGTVLTGRRSSSDMTIVGRKNRGGIYSSRLGSRASMTIRGVGNVGTIVQR